jgi:hypothetical protein
LFAKASFFTIYRRKTDCCKSGNSEAEWLIEKSTNNYTYWNGVKYDVNDTYTLKNVNYGHYLYDAEYPDDSSLVIWTKSSPSVPFFRFWKISRLTSREFTIRSPRGKYINQNFTVDAPGRWEFIDLQT